MNPEIDSVFHLLAELDPEARQRYYADHSVSAEVQKEVESLIAFDAGSTGFLARGLIESAAEAMESGLTGERCGAYRLLRVIGSGGMGTVYLAERADGELRQHVAIKLLRPGVSDPTRIERFLRERQILASLNHPHIARLLDAGRREDSRMGTGQPYLVMEYVDGAPVDQYAASLTVREKIGILLQVCDAVSYAHRNLIVHRDIKPANIVVDSAGQAKLLDFGIAKILDETAVRTLTVQRMLTPEYSSPEQIADQLVTTAVDVYSLGAVLYKLLTGRGPHEFEGTTPEGLLMAIQTREPTRPSRLVPELRGDLELILAKCLRKEPEQRYRNADELADDLRAFLESRPISARRGEWSYRARRFARRYWIPLAAGAAVLIALAGGLIATEWERRLAERRFHLVRELAAKLFEIESRVSPLAGSIPARQYIAETALSYLNQLGAEASDPDLALEIAEGYKRTALVLNRRDAPSLGQGEAAYAALESGAKLLRRALEKRPNHVPTLRASIDNTMQRIGSLNSNERAVEAIALVPEVEGLLSRLLSLSNEPKELQLAAICASGIHVAFLNAGRTRESRKYAEQNLDYARRFALAESSPLSQRQLAGSMRVFGIFLRYEGELERAVQLLQESITVTARMADSRDKQLLLEMEYYYLGLAKGEVDALSLGDEAGAEKALNRSLEILRPLIAADPLDHNAKVDFAMAGVKLGRLLAHRDPARALQVLDETIRVMRAAPAGAVKRTQYLDWALAESSQILLQMKRPAEAASKLAEASRESFGDEVYFGPKSTGEAMYRAEAEQKRSRGQLRDAIAIVRAMLQKFEKSGFHPGDDLADAYGQSLAESRLSSLLREAGDRKEAEEIEAKLAARWIGWDKTLPNNSFVRRQLVRWPVHQH